MSSEKEESIFDRLASFTDRTIQRPFRVIGETNGLHPYRIMCACLIISLSLASGMVKMGDVTESRSDKLWFPQNTETEQDKKKYEENFPRNGAISYYIAEARQGSNLLNIATFQDLMELHLRLTTMTTSKGKNLADLCVPASEPGTSCYLSNPLAAWDYDQTKLEDETSDESLRSTLNSYFTSAELESFFGKKKFNDTSGDLVRAKAVKVSYFLADDTEVINGEYVTEDNDLWEWKFLKSVSDASSSNVKYFAAATRSWGDVFGEAIRGDLVLIQLAYFIMIIYMSVNLGSLPCGCCPCFCGCRPSPSAKGSRVLLALTSVSAIVLAMLSAIGLCAAMGFIWSPVHVVLPFVILGLGVDDSFVIVNAFDRTSRDDPIPVRMRDALSHAATSITVTSLTDLVAFAISTSSALPALSSFCMYAAVAITFLFLLQITFFASAVCIDEERQLKLRVDCCPCCTNCCIKGNKKIGCSSSCGDDDKVSKDLNQPNEQGKVSKILEEIYSPIILRGPSRIFIVSLFLLLLVLCCSLGLPNLTVEDNERSFITDGSYLLKTLTKDDKYFGDQGEILYVVTGNVDYFSSQSNLAAIKQDVSSVDVLRDPYETDSYDSWYDSFIEYCSSPGLCTGYDTDEEAFYKQLRDFLSGAGGRYNNSIVFDGPFNIVASRIETQFKDMSVWNDGRRQEDSTKVVSAMNKVRNFDWSVKAFPWSYAFFKWEAFRIIQEELITNVILCLAAVFFITTLLIGHPGCSGLVFVCVAMTVIDILGCMYWWGMFIDNVSVIQTVIAIGLCVDYSAHVGHAFMLKTGSREERVTASLADVGAAVLNGGISTFLAVLFLAGSQSYVFRVFFQQFFLTVVLGLAHGMILLPVLLATVGPKCYSNAEKEKSEGSRKKPALELAKKSTIAEKTEIVELGVKE